ncbi:hypothetical protein VKT23_016719 [Stygiomarasmius scandens]|uniref:HAT C-terminal dimerisation domain-containing protein n=1 Tax=Marasmiellus scandens TaxID=2682957 RepID=A0ABR1IWU1_9AGAR
MIAALILNPYERLSCFGPNAGANILNLNKLVCDLFKASISRLHAEFQDPDQVEELTRRNLERITQFSTAFLHYSASDGPFKEWTEEKQAHFGSIHKNDPVKFWQAMQTDGNVIELADFAIKIFHIVMNTAANERDFSKVRLRKDRLRNRLGDEKLRQEIMISTNLIDHHYADGLKEVRKARKNHSDDRVDELLSVPRYATLIREEVADDAVQPAYIVVNSRQKWRAELKKWVEQAQLFDQEMNDDSIAPPLPEGTTRAWLPRSLEMLFGGAKPVEPDNPLQQRLTRRRREVPSEEGLLMELFALEQEEYCPDDGELEGSGDEYDGH